MPLGVLRVDPQADGDTSHFFFPQRAKTFKLIEGVENQMIGNAEQFYNVAFFEGSGEAMYLPTELIPPQACLPGGRTEDTEALRLSAFFREYSIRGRSQSTPDQTAHLLRNKQGGG